MVVIIFNCDIVIYLLYALHTRLWTGQISTMLVHSIRIYATFGLYISLKQKIMSVNLDQ